jgi:ABC-2 type transport system ATP-binding protein
MFAIEVDDLFKSYGSFNAVRGISFHVEQGEVFALLGPNGAGKTTTLEILEGQQRRSGGHVSVLGADPQLRNRALRERIGVAFQSAGIDGELTVREVIAMYASCYSRPLPTKDVISVVGLEDKSGARVKTLSGGQRRRVDLALALIGDPDLIFLDEPTTGFDPAARRGAWDLVRNLRGLGRTIVLCSHYMDEVQHLADRAAVMMRGRIVAEGRPDALAGQSPQTTLISFHAPDPRILEQLPPQLRCLATEHDGEVGLRCDEPTRVLAQLCDWAVRRGLELPELEVTRPTLEDAYLQLTEGEDDATG